MLNVAGSGSNNNVKVFLMREELYCIDCQRKKKRLNLYNRVSLRFRSVSFCLWSVQIGRRVQPGHFQHRSNWFSDHLFFHPLQQQVFGALQKPGSRCVRCHKCKIHTLSSLLHLHFSVQPQTTRAPRQIPSSQCWTEIELDAVAFPKL